jgi:hypothetical protein
MTPITLSHTSIMLCIPWILSALLTGCFSQQERLPEESEYQWLLPGRHMKNVDPTLDSGSRSRESDADAASSASDSASPESGLALPDSGTALPDSGTALPEPDGELSTDSAWAGDDADQCDAIPQWSTCDDSDGDGFGPGCALGEDCNDNDDSVFRLVMRYVDNDNDGFGGEDVEFLCAGHGTVALPRPGDCDDLDPFAAPGAIDLPDDGVDQDCDGLDLLGSTLDAVYLAEGHDGTGTAVDPLGSLAEAVALAEQRGVPVLMAAGTYQGTTTTVSLFGGYQYHDGLWSRDRAGEPTVIEGVADQWGRNIALTVNSEEPLVLDGLTLRAGDAQGNGFTNGLRMPRVGEVTVAFCDIASGRSSQISVGLRVDDPDGQVTVRSSRIHGGEGRQTRGVWSHSDLTLYGNDIDGGDALEDDAVGLWLEAGPAAWVTHNHITGGRGRQTTGGGISSFLLPSGQSPEPIVLLHNLIEGRNGGEGNSFGLFIFESASSAEQEPVNLLLVNNVIAAGAEVTRFRGIYSEVGQLWLLHNLWEPVEPGQGALVAGGEGIIVTADDLNDCNSEAWRQGACVRSENNRLASPGVYGDFLAYYGNGLSLGIDPLQWYDDVVAGAAQ